MKNGKIRKPTVIQSRSFPAFSGNSHLVLASQSGSGKTIAYAAPIISQMIASKRDKVDRLRHKGLFYQIDETILIFKQLS
jgi:superfamily II DNA/RNA helicase